jgi:hypothetical protein
MTKTRAMRVILAGLTAATILGTAPAAFARQGSGGGGGITKTGSCSDSSTWKLKAKPDNGQLEVEFEVDSNVVGQKWNVTLKDNGVKFFSGTATTKAPSGSFEVKKNTSDKAGTDTIRGAATNPSTGETCNGSLSV